MRRRVLLGALAAPGVARAEAAWPARPVRILVPFPPGGSTDILARGIGQPLAEALGQPFIIENRGGAGGTVGTEAAARAAPDGYTLVLGHVGTLAVNPALYAALDFTAVAALLPVLLIATVPNLLLVNPRRIAATDIQGLLAEARRRPGELTYGTGGNGSAAHIATVAFCAATGIALTHVPYRGTAPMMSDLIAGQTDLTITGGPPGLPPVRAGQLRALGVTSLARLGTAPEIPTIAEQGVPGFEAVQWHGLLAPAGTPRAIIERVNAAGLVALRDARLRPRLAAEGAEAAAATPEEFGALILAERARWGALVRQAGMRPD